MAADNRVILLVEDNPADQKLTRMAFEMNRLSNPLVIANDGEEALSYLFGTNGRNVRECPELIILDLKLPKIDGFEVLARIRQDERTKYIPVVILTSSKEQEDLVKAYDIGSNAYIPKPVDFNHFIEAIKQLGLFWLVFNKAPDSKH